MKRFPMQAVLGYRENLEEMAQLALSQVQLEYQKIEQKIEKEKKHLQGVRQEFEQCQKQGTDAMTLVLYQQCLEGTSHNLQKLDHELKLTDQKVQEKKQALYQARTDKKKLQKLKERHDHWVQTEENRLETEHMDDVAISRWGRKNW